MSATGRMWKLQEKPIVLAHRAGGNEAPENSLLAFANMEEKGFKYIESDVHASRDGVVVIFHDDTLERTTNGRGKIAHKSWAELTEVRDHSGHSLLRFADVLEKFPQLVLNIDSKEWQVIRHLVREIKIHDAQERISLSSFSEMRLKVLRRLLPGVTSSLGEGALVLLVLAAHLPFPLQNILCWFVPGNKQKVEAVQVPVAAYGIKIITPAFIRLCHQRGLAVHVWTINEEVEMRRLLELGIDALITDEPSRARRVIEEFWASKAENRPE